MVQETLPRRPLVLDELKPKLTLGKEQRFSKISALKQKYSIETEDPEKLLAHEIQTEIDET